MIRRFRIAVVVVGVAIVAWWGIGRVRSTAPGSPGESAPASRAAGLAGAGPGGSAHAHTAQLLPGAAHEGGDVTIAGRVIDIRQQQPVGNVEVVFRSPSGENATTTRSDGSYAIRIPAGTYRAFVRDDTVLSVGRPDPARLPAPPSAEAAGLPEEALMTVVVASADTDGVDLSVVRGGIVSGHVVDHGGHPIGDAVLRARGDSMRPALATDVAETDEAGSFELRLPTGTFTLDVSHPRFAGIAGVAARHIAVEPGDHKTLTITLAAGCVISGRVVGRDGKNAGEGAIEKQWSDSDLDYNPVGRIESDGTFRWVTTDEVDVTLRAWPWNSPPSPGRKFTCRDGARFDGVVFQLPDVRPDVSGVLVDKTGKPVGLAFLDLQPLGRSGVRQQARTDATGRFAIYHLAPGRYRITAQAEGRGVTTQSIVSPRDGVRLELSGTGRIEGTTPRLGSGSFELLIGTCRDSAGTLALPASRRQITVTDGHFTVDDVPACDLSFGAIWHGQRIPLHAQIPSGGTAHVAIDLGPSSPRRSPQRTRRPQGAWQGR